MRILLVSEFYYPLLGGITEHIYGYAKQCLTKGHQVSLMTSNSGKIPPELHLPGLEIHRVGRGFPVVSNHSFARITLGPFLGYRIRSILENGNYDVVHIHSPLTPVLPLLSLRYKCSPTVGTLHTNFDRSRLYEILQKQVQKKVNTLDGIISVSQNGIDSLKKYFSFDATVIPNGVDVSLFQSGKMLPQFQNKPFKIFFIGRMDPRNSVGLLLEAFYILQKRNIPSHLIVAGDGHLRSFYENSVPAKYREKITFAGYIHQQRPDYYASADTFCFPVSKACFSVTLLEAMSAGLPVVVPNIGAFADVITNGVSGFLTQEGDPKSIADALQTLAEDKNTRIRMSENIKRKAQEYSWDKVSDRILDFYRKLEQPSFKALAVG